MPQDTAFPKAGKAENKVFEAPSAHDGLSAFDEEAERPRPAEFPVAPTRTARTQDHLQRTLMLPALRFWQAVPAMLREEGAYGHGFLFVPVIIASGSVFWFLLPQSPGFWPVLIAFSALAVLSAGARHRAGALRPILFAFALFLGGMLLAELETWRRGTIILDSAVTTNLTGIVERREIDAEGRWRYIVKIAKTTEPEIRRPPERVSLLARARHLPLETGETINGRVRLSPPSGPALPRLNDFAFSSYFDGIGAVGFFYGAPKKEVGPALPLSWRAEAERFLFDLRGAIATHIRETVPGDAGAFAAAIVTDERRAISHETTEALRLSGLAHIVAISGLNMALAAGIFFVGVRTLLSLFTGFAQAYAIKKIAALGALAMATAYYLISGFGVSAERAYIMMAVMLIAALFDRPSISLRNVALSALIIIAISPSETLGPSFQMSFAATAALVAGYALWKRRTEDRDPEPLPFRHPLVPPLLASWNFAAGIFVTSLIGGISTAIFSVEHFHRIATYGLAANLAAMPIISFVVMPAGLVGMLLMPFGLDGPFLKLMGLGLEAVIAIAEHVAGWGGDVGIGRQHPWFLAIATIGFVLLTLLRTKLRLIGIPLLFLAVALSRQEHSRPVPDILVSEDGTMIALTGPKGTVVNRSRPPAFIYNQWKSALLLGDSVRPEMLPSPQPPSPRTGSSDGATTDERRPLTRAEIEAARLRIRQAPEGRFACETRIWCLSRTDEGIIVAAVEDARYAGAACDAAQIVIAPRARFDRCRSGALMINGDMLRKTGALEMSLGGSADTRLWRIQTAMAGVYRPWSRHRHYDWRSQSFDTQLPEPFLQLLNDSGG